VDIFISLPGQSMQKNNSGFTTRPLTDDETLIFYHVPKTAGSTVLKLLSRHLSRKNICVIRPKKLEETFATEDFSQYRAVVGHFGPSRDSYFHPPLRRFSFLRDPLERILSYYSYVREAKDNRAHHLATTLSINEFLVVEDPLVQANVFNRATSLLCSDPSRSWPEMLETAKSNLDKLDFIGLQEQFSESIICLQYVLGWQIITPDVSMRITNSRLQKHDIKASTIKLILDQNYYDYELYEYGKKIFREKFVNLFSALMIPSE
jgi:hypothetical protein